MTDIKFTVVYFSKQKLFYFGWREIPKIKSTIFLFQRTQIQSVDLAPVPQPSATPVPGDLVPSPCFYR